MTPKEIEKLLAEYYDLPRMIHSELEEIKALEEEQKCICPPSPNLTGMPGGKGRYSDPTAALALSEILLEYEREADACRARAVELREKKNWCRSVLNELGRVERRVLELAYMGPQDLRARNQWKRRPAWKEIADEVAYSESQTRHIAVQAVRKLAARSQEDNPCWKAAAAVQRI